MTQSYTPYSSRAPIYFIGSFDQVRSFALGMVFENEVTLKNIIPSIRNIKCMQGKKAVTARKYICWCKIELF